MAADSEQIEIMVEDIQTAQEIVENIAKIKPLTSFSFTLSSEGQKAVNITLQLIEWGIGKNKAKLKQAALDVVSPLSGTEPGEPNNINLTEFEIKAMEAILGVIERALSKQKDGVLTL